MSFIKQLFIAFSLIGFSTLLFAQNTLSHPLCIVTFNVLAPCWANPSLYPTTAKPYLEREWRRKHIIEFLNRIANSADIISLQETTQTEFGFFKEALKQNFYAFQAYHDPNYWSGWISPGIPWEPNGVAIFVKKSTFTNVNFIDLPLTKDGNHCAFFSGIEQLTGLKVHAVAVHFDNDHAYNRSYELGTLLHFLDFDRADRDIIAGDFNFGTESGTLKHKLDYYHFVDVLHRLKKEVWTHPFDMAGDRNSGIIDHIVVRNAEPLDGKVCNFGLWKLYPKDETGRVIANFKRCGSDHFPVFGEVK